MTDRELMQQVLDALEKIIQGCNDVERDERIHKDGKDVAKLVRIDCREPAETLRTRLAQPEPEPVAWMHSLTGGGWQVVPEKKYPTDRPLYTAPPQRDWQGLTDEERYLGDARSEEEIEYAKAIEAKLKEKNA
jgi:hypothetical protein